MDSTRYLKMATDLATEFDIAKFQSALSEWRTVIQKVLQQPRPDTHRLIAKEKILHYLDLQLERAAKWTTEADLLGLIFRRLIELRFWTEYATDEMKAEAFVYEAGIDAREVAEWFAKAYPEGPHVEAPCFPVGKRITVTQESEEEKLFWKISTKFVHGSSMAIVYAKDSKLNGTFTQMFAVQMLMYAWRIIEVWDEPVKGA
jgi:hypothetical protein